MEDNNEKKFLMVSENGVEAVPHLLKDPQSKSIHWVNRREESKHVIWETPSDRD